jgi:hypothetical protein
MRPAGNDGDADCDSESAVEQTSIDKQEKASLVENVGGAEGIKSGSWFISLITASLRAYFKNATPEYFRRKYPNISDDQIAAKLIHIAVWNATYTGAASGAAMSASEVVGLVTSGAALPIAIPAAVGSVAVDMIWVTQIQLKLIASLAALYGPALDPDDPEDVLLLVHFFLGSKLSDIIGTAGSKLGAVASEKLIKRYAVKGTLEAIQVIGRRIGLKILQRTIVNSIVPVVSIGLGGGANYLTTNAVAATAQAVMKARGEQYSSHLRPA